MVGISNYKGHYYKVWKNIHGKQDVDLLAPVLKKHGFAVTSVLDEKATRERILSGLYKFIDATKKGDIAYLHFSCHGQPVEDGLKGDSLDEEDGWDESLVPIDAGKEYSENGYKGEKHITDDELNIYIERLRKRLGARGMLYVVMDACHAGNMERGDFETVRGTNEGLTRKAEKKYNPPEIRKGSKIEQSANLSPILYVEACESYERNQEIVFNGEELGALSFNIWQTLNTYDEFPSSVMVFRSRLLQNVESNKKKRNRLWPASQNLVIEQSR